MRYLRSETGRELTLPDFLVIGAQKAGTSTLYEFLEAHPDVSMASRSEVEFFSDDRRYHAGLCRYGRYFRSAQGGLVGEVSPGYLYNDNAAIRVKSHLPNCKIIASLRDPVDRAFSAWKMQVLKGSETETFDRAIRKDPSYIVNGQYYSQLRRYFDLFRRGDILILLFDDLCHRPDVFFGELCRFLGVRENPSHQLGHANPGGLPRFDSVAKGMNLAYRARNWLRATPLRPLVDYLLIDTLSRRLRNAVASWNRNAAAATPPMSIDAARYILAAVEDDIQSTAQLIGRNLDAWRDPNRGRV